VNSHPNTTGSLLSLEELDPGRFRALLDAAAQDVSSQTGSGALRGKAVAFIADRRSVRTRIATQLAAHGLGAGFIDIPWETFYADPSARSDHARFAGEELRSLADLGVACLVARVTDHAVLEMWHATGALPIVNGCSNREHPLQGLADALTIERQLGSLRGVRLAFVGNGASPVLASLLELTRLGGLSVSIVTPERFRPEKGRLYRLALEDCWTSNLAAGLDGADVVYADEAFYRRPTGTEMAVFAPYQVTAVLVERHCPNAAIMHCLPHGDEIEQSVLDRPTSLVREQVRMRIPVTRAVLAAVR
jgi:ornithine carbamoyltransferase